MLAPLSWLKDYVDITLEPKKLGDRLTEIGLTTEKVDKHDGDTVFEFEITPNRPDLLSIIGVAREIAAVEEENIKFPPLQHNLSTLKPANSLPLEISTDTTINPRFTGIIIDGISVDESPHWLKDRLIKIGQRPINNIVDITNYVMLELGNPIHAFDYEKIEGKKMRVHQTRGGEEFKSVDGIVYHLPKGAVVISDEKRIIDLCGIKGGYNSGTFEQTKTIFIRVPVEIPVLIRRASISLGLRSEASSIFERGVNSGGTVDALTRTTDLVLKIAGGKIASALYDIKDKEFVPWKLTLRLSKLHQVLGIVIPEAHVVKILQHLNLSPKKIAGDKLEVLVPTYRNDLKIEEDIMEEVARLYGYNKFPKTMPSGEIPIKEVPYFRDYGIDEKIKQIFQAAGFSEVYTYSLISENDLKTIGIDSGKVLRVDNPISRDYEYLRPSLKANLLKALQVNAANEHRVNLFELGKVYIGESLDKAREPYYLSGITNAKNYHQVKGILELLLSELGATRDLNSVIHIMEEGVFFELDLSELLSKTIPRKIFSPIPKYPPIIEDMAIVAPEKVKTGSLIETIKTLSHLISEVSLLDTYQNTRTFHIVYQDKAKNLTNQEVSVIRAKILKVLQEKFNAQLKE